MVSIELRDISIHANHGVNEGEEKTGSSYMVNLTVQFEAGDEAFEKLEDTINYVHLYEIVKQRMQIPTPLLEALCESIIRRIKHQFPLVTRVDLSIYKLQPPIENFDGKVGVSMSKQFDV